MSPPRLDMSDLRTVPVTQRLDNEHPDDLAAEIERLRHDLADLREAQAQHRMDNEHAYDEGYDAGTRRGYESERAAVVAWLRECAQGHDGLGSRNTGNLLRTLADAIERGEHRREEKP